jgi:hypothetical protein
LHCRHESLYSALSHCSYPKVSSLLWINTSQIVICFCPISRVQKQFW